jgi:hypothetical protein
LTYKVNTIFTFEPFASFSSSTFQDQCTYQVVGPMRCQVINWRNVRSGNQQTD